jgi:hypothetical protein
MLKGMRRDEWRTAMGAIASHSLDFVFAGSGKVTLWPGLMRKIGGNAVYPIQYCGKEGTVLAIFDTIMELRPGPIGKLAGDASMTAGGPFWLMSGERRCGVRWPYNKDSSASVKTRIRMNAGNCLAAPYNGTLPPKKLAADGMSCGMNLEWEF